MEFPDPPHPRKDKIIPSVENSTCIMTDYSLQGRNQKKKVEIYPPFYIANGVGI